MSATPAPRGDGRRFSPTSGTLTGWTGIVLAVVAVAAVLAEDRTLGGLRLSLGAAVFGLLVWCYMLRPRVIIGTAELELRNAFSSWHVPLADVRKVVVRAITRVYTDDRRYDGVAVGRPVRSMRRGRPVQARGLGLPGLGATITQDTDTAAQPRGQLDADMVADFVVEQILYAADRARDSSEAAAAPAHRRWAWPEIVALTVLAAGLVGSLLV